MAMVSRSLWQAKCQIRDRKTKLRFSAIKAIKHRNDGAFHFRHDMDNPLLKITTLSLETMSTMSTSSGEKAPGISRGLNSGPLAPTEIMI